MAKKKKVIELFIDEDDPKWGVTAMSLVDFPAIQQNFIACSQQKGNNLVLAKQVEQQMLYGPALIPNKEIYRYDQNTGEEYWIKFSGETVRKAAHLFFRNNNHKNVTVDHQFAVNGCTAVESWLKESEFDKSRHFGFQCPVETWFLGMKIENDAVWTEMVKTGAVRGFSIEGFFVEQLMRQQLRYVTDDELVDILVSLLGED